MLIAYTGWHFMRYAIKQKELRSLAFVINLKIEATKHTSKIKICIHFLTYQ